MVSTVRRVTWGTRREGLGGSGGQEAQAAGSPGARGPRDSPGSTESAPKERAAQHTRPVVDVPLRPRLVRQPPMGRPPALGPLDQVSAQGLERQGPGKSEIHAQLAEALLPALVEVAPGHQKLGIGVLSAQGTHPLEVF